MIVWRMSKLGSDLDIAFNNDEAAKHLISKTTGYSRQRQTVAMDIDEFMILGQMPETDFFMLLDAESKGFENKRKANTYRSFITLANYLYHLRKPESVLEFLTDNYMELPTDLLYALSMTFKQYLISYDIGVDKLISPPLDTSGINFFVGGQYHKMFSPFGNRSDNSVIPCHNYGCDLYNIPSNVEKLGQINRDNCFAPVYYVYETVYAAYRFGKNIEIKIDLFGAIEQSEKDSVNREIVRAAMSTKRYDTAFPKDERHLA